VHRSSGWLVNIIYVGQGREFFSSCAGIKEKKIPRSIMTLKAFMSLLYFYFSLFGFADTPHEMPSFLF
jgi:hypothetical protein